MNDDGMVLDKYMNYSRWYCEPCYGQKDKISSICNELTINKNGHGSINLEFFINTRQYSNGIYSIAIFQIINNVQGNMEDDQLNEECISSDSIGFANLADKCDDEKEAISYEEHEIDESLFDRLFLFDQLQIKLKNINAKNILKPLQENELSFPKNLFTCLKSSIPLRICSATPHEVRNRYIFTFSNDQERDIILKNVEYFAKKTPFTHFIALPIAPNFPEWTEAMKTVLSRWNVNVKNHINRTHITIALFVINNEDDLNLVNQIVTETINEIEWPEDNTLKTSKIGCFGSPSKAKILFIEPELNAFVECLTKFIDTFVSKMNDNGFGYVEEDSHSLHITMIRPNLVKKQYSFDATKYISDFKEDELPIVHIQELRLVQRFVYDEDDFYKTHFHYPLYQKDNENNDTNDE